MEWIKVAASVVGGWLGWFLGDIDGLLIALVVLAVVDYITGVMVAISKRQLSSAVGFVGICRKVLMFALVGIGNIIDVRIICSGAVLRTAVLCFYLANEGISIIENASLLGLPVPKKLQSILQQLKSTADEENGKEDENDEQ